MERIEDMPLSEVEMRQILDWADMYGVERAEEFALSMQMSKYREQFLDSRNISHHSRMCYSSGEDAFFRKDGQPMTEEDVRAVDGRRIGQGHSIVGKAGDMEIRHQWSVDSSD